MLCFFNYGGYKTHEKLFGLVPIGSFPKMTCIPLNSDSGLDLVGWICPNHQGSRVWPRHKVETFPGINFSAHNIVPSGAAVSSELIKKVGEMLKIS